MDMPSLAEGMSIFCGHGWAYRDYAQSLVPAEGMSRGQGQWPPGPGTNPRTPARGHLGPSPLLEMGLE